jgi:hypothetical protein
MTYEEINAISPIGLAAIARTASGEKHQDYSHTVELAELYHKVITGDKIETLIKKFAQREDETMFQQRVNITQSITRAICRPAINPFYKVSRVNNVVNKIDFKDATDIEGKKQRLDVAVDNYYGEESLDDYMAGRFVEISFFDPNAFIVTEFIDGERDANKNLTTPVKPYPIEYSSAQCVNFKYTNNILQWLVTCFADEKIPDKNKYVIYLPVSAITFEPIDEKLFDTVSEKSF